MKDIPNRVCIIGAGSSGIAAAKVLKDHGIPFDCYEVSDRIGGNWAYDNPNGMSSAYKSLFINTSKPRMQFSDYPMPERYPIFPHHTQIAEYFNNYVEHFGVKQYIRFNTTVTLATLLTGGGWEITLQDGSTHRYRALLVASGHHWDPRWPYPPFPGQFDGVIIHSHSYKQPDEYADKHVLVVGFGNSSVDIAAEASRVSAMTYLSVRRGCHVIPKFIMGKPLDQLYAPDLLPFAWQLKIYGAIVRLNVGKVTDYGLPEPDHQVGQAHPTVSSDILNRIAHGRIKVKANIQRLDGDGVIFTDGTREHIDRIIYCTGYKVTFPFFKPEVIEVKNNDLPLFKRVFHPRYRDLFFIGLLQPLGAIMPLAELQSIWVSKYLLGEYTLPKDTEMQRDMEHERNEMRKRYGNSPRHTMQVDFAPYVASVRKEMKRGAQRSSTPLIQRESQVLAD
ncbi:MAG: NAD(P)/FAD-dependent oxidoreductase [Chloroflexi bacterium]|nr:MAG: NAD(P)/FAD-dependent oxidoreductase [Chloroflexota bacterium]